jgi:hypothetical protein
MPAARAEEVERFALVMVHPTREEDGSLTHILHTLLPEERPTEVRRLVCVCVCVCVCVWWWGVFVARMREPFAFAHVLIAPYRT